MERPKLKATVREAAAENWVKKSKVGKYPSTKKIRTTLYVSEEAWSLLWHERANTRKSISGIFEELVFSRFGKAKQKTG